MKEGRQERKRREIREGEVFRSVFQKSAPISGFDVICSDVT